MRILYYADGRYIHAERWMTYLVSRGHEMHLISFEEISKKRAAEIRDLGIKYHGSTGLFHIKKFWRTFRDLRFVRSILKREKIQVLHSHFLGPNIWYGALSRFHPHVITVMGADVVGENWEPTGSPQDRFLTPFALKRADAVTAWSDLLARRVKPFVRQGTEVSVVHGGVELDLFTPGSPKFDLKSKLGLPANARVVLSSRLIRPLYNIDAIAEAANLVSARLADIFFLMTLPETILDSDYVEKIKNIFASGPAKERVRFLPTIEHSEMTEYHRLADVTVSIPSTDGTPMTVLESMACGTPTVIGNLPDYDKEYFEHEKTTLMVNVKQPDEIADAIMCYLTDVDLRERVTTEARRRVLETGGYEYQMSKMGKIYESLFNG